MHGGGDPFLISEELALLATELVAAIGKKPIAGIMLDASYFPADLRIPGVEDTNKSFDTLNSALAVNFNTINAVRRGNKVEVPPRSRRRSLSLQSVSFGRGGRTAAAALA